MSAALTYHLKRALAALGTGGLIAGLAALQKGAGGPARGTPRGRFGARRASGWLAALGTRLLVPTRARHGVFASLPRVTLVA